VFFWLFWVFDRNVFCFLLPLGSSNFFAFLYTFVLECFLFFVFCFVVLVLVCVLSVYADGCWG